MDVVKFDVVVRLEEKMFLFWMELHCDENQCYFVILDNSIFVCCEEEWKKLKDLIDEEEEVLRIPVCQHDRLCFSSSMVHFFVVTGYGS